MAVLRTKRVVAAAAVGGGGLTVLTGASIGLVMAEAKLARKAIGHTVDAPPRADGLFGEHLARVSSTYDTHPTTLGASTSTHPNTASSTKSTAGSITNGTTDTVAPTHTHPTASAPVPSPVPTPAHAHAHAPERPLRFAILGDSTAAGYGVEHADQTPGALLAAALAAHAGRPLLLANVARIGALSEQLCEQIDALLADGPENAPQVAAIMIGTNDVTNRASLTEAAEQLGEAVTRLRAVGCQVVTGTCPDLGTIRPIQVPLRWLARRWSRRLATLQARAVHDAGGRSVPIGALLGPEFAARAELFGPDRFHPSAEGYATAAAAMLPALAAAVWQLTRAMPTPPQTSTPAPTTPPAHSPTLTRQ
ncbi:MAG TPA: GDSL-type esterase/lipase family protein [Actinocrinis sp.]|uniref:SGNH/GDSL hydrolase family protein n=1 Tax=Actinocrinis sp. TaxID=1920516 RepID=UPI002DDD6BC8|nr:GDSL-type esterase/lipase family protein [Actinocrinis sp.]HEV2347828.1 GDSL-type esterase/lipase family protein [Actinocrinis sp.]